MTFLRSRRGVIITSSLVLLALFLVRPGAQWLRGRITRNMSIALGRPADIQSVSIRLLPQPAFELGDFVVYDPAFGAEPMVRAGEVRAAIRLWSLLRGRLEISTLSLSEPSLNLARGSDGHWNLEDLLTRAANTPVAPTSKARSEKRPGFPYIEADHARINFKFGQEKTPYALTNADFALWQQSENSWGMRLSGQPVRTDFNMTDTGVVKVSGTWRRAASLRETPLQFTVQWSGAQLGQATKLASGNDQGWRGTINLNGSVSGRPSDLLVTGGASVQDFRRYDVMRSDAIRLATQCNGRYSSVDQTISGVRCKSAVGDGSLVLSGNLSQITGARSYDFAVSAQQVPVHALAALIRHASKKLPDDLAVSGTLDGNLHVQRSPGDPAPIWTGNGETEGLEFASERAPEPLSFGAVPFSLASAIAGSEEHRSRPGKHRNPTSNEKKMEVGPVSIAFGKGNLVTVDGELSKAGYSAEVKGNGQLQRLLEVARMFHLSALNPSADGIAQIDLQLGGAWTDARPGITGKGQLRHVRAEIHGVNAPLEIESAALAINENTVNVQNLSATLGKMSWRGTMMVERQTAENSDACRNINFDLRADELSTDELNQLLNPHVRNRPWYHFLEPSSDTRAPYLLTACATGKFAVARVTIHHLVATHVSGRIDLQHGKLNVSGLLGNVLGGKHVGVWQADFTAKPPEYGGSGVFQHVALQQLATAMHDGWVSGMANGSYKVKSSGLTLQALLSSADGSLDVNAHDTSFPHLSLVGASQPIRASQLNAHFLLRDGKLSIDEGKLESQGGIYELSGTASLARKLDLKLVRDNAHSFSITGSLAEPRVQPFSTKEARAALKP